MWALVEDNVITKIINQPKGMVIDDIRYSRKIFELWSEEELNNVGLYSVIFDDSNKRNEEFYINTNQSFNYADGQVTASYGSATGKEIDDVTIDGVTTKGLKTIKKEIVKKQADTELSKTDWYVVRKADDGTLIPSAITEHRTAVRNKSNEMETAINNALDIDALASLYIYTDGERPLGEFPTLEI